MEVNIYTCNSLIINEIIYKYGRYQYQHFTYDS
jgi:hypothetical protein